jgi:hypothetical protein
MIRPGGYYMPFSLDLFGSPVRVRLFTALLLVGLLLAGSFLAGCSSARAPISDAAAQAEPSEGGPAENPGEEQALEGLWDMEAQSMRDVPVESWAELEVDEFNSTVEAAVDSGQTWPKDPIDVVDRFIWGPIGGANYTRLEKQDNRVEAPDSTVITLIRDRWADDSIRGDWHRISLYRLPDGTWRLSEARRAFRCYRGHQQGAYGERLCL